MQILNDLMNKQITREVFQSRKYNRVVEEFHWPVTKKSSSDMLLKKSLVYYSIFCHLSSFYQHEFEFGDQKIFPMGTFVCIHTGGILCRPKITLAT